jgi:hypothetical protein
LYRHAPIEPSLEDIEPAIALRFEYYGLTIRGPGVRVLTTTHGQPPGVVQAPSLLCNIGHKPNRPKSDAAEALNRCAG